MRNVVAVFISIGVVVAIFVALGVLFRKPSIVPERLEIAAQLQKLDFRLPVEFSNPDEHERMKEFLENISELTLEAAELFNEGEGKAHRFNGKDWVNGTMRDGEIGVRYDFYFDGVLQGIVFREAGTRLFLARVRLTSEGKIAYLNAGDIFVTLAADQSIQSYSRDLGDRKRFVFELDEEGSVYRNGEFDSKKRIKTSQ